MYAIVEFKGNQFSVKKDAIIKVPYWNDEENGKDIEISDVLMLRSDDSVLIGKPKLENVKVTAEVVEQGREKKVIVFKKEKKKTYAKKQGHRQQFTKIKIKDIMVEGE